jgi:predicted transcriptional regulator
MMGIIDEDAERLLAALLRTDTPVSGRALARMVGMSQSSAQRALVKLRHAGLVTTEHAPPAILYRLNRDHLAVDAIASLLATAQRLRDGLAREIRRWRVRPLSAVLYGSVARGTAVTATSDVDILLIRPDEVGPDDPDWARQAADLGEKIRRWTGRPASVIELSGREARSGLADGEPFLQNAVREGLLLAGSPLRSVTGPAA